MLLALMICAAQSPPVAYCEDDLSCGWLQEECNQKAQECSKGDDVCERGRLGWIRGCSHALATCRGQITETVDCPALLKNCLKLCNCQSAQGVEDCQEFRDSCDNACKRSDELCTQKGGKVAN